MALTPYQRQICQLLANSRKTSGESYVAGGTALNTWLNAPRLSHDVDIFHDTTEALQASWQRDQQILMSNGHSVTAIRETVAFVEALIVTGTDKVVLQWVRDSAFRFFPLLEHDELGLTLHPFDLATNKVLALVGRLEIRDWIDVQVCSDRLQHLGFLAWAACAKDPGFSPMMILEEAGRSTKYSRTEFETLIFAGPAPDLTALSQRWRIILSEARAIVDCLPAEQVGKCLLTPNGELFQLTPAKLRHFAEWGTVHWHEGTIGGVLPAIKE